MRVRSTPQHPEKLLYLGGVVLMGLFTFLAFGWLFAVLTALLLAVGLLVVTAVRRGVRALRSGRGRGAWPMLALATAPVSLLGLLVSYCVGAFSGALRVDKSCRVRQEPYDAAYRAQHAAETDRWFPLHNKCNAHFDLVPGWVNPAVVIFAVLLVASLCTVAVAAVVHLRMIRTRRNT
ncbi:hypothetical protein AB0H77_34515 [Streptomyces sp. NPDC050844]|uniref:hypothetical protein n=1 Tax=Streptomyces sp. NPDC050844 TaxID=3155790 RepID=UPI0033CF931E